MTTQSNTPSSAFQEAKQHRDSQWVHLETQIKAGLKYQKENWSVLHPILSERVVPGLQILRRRLIQSGKKILPSKLWYGLLLKYLITWFQVALRHFHPLTGVAILNIVLVQFPVFLLACMVRLIFLTILAIFMMIGLLYQWTKNLVVLLYHFIKRHLLIIVIILSLLTLGYAIYQMPPLAGASGAKTHSGSSTP